MHVTESRVEVGYSYIDEFVRTKKIEKLAQALKIVEENGSKLTRLKMSERR